MARLLVLSAPGAWSICWRLTGLVLVEESGFTVGATSCTSMDSALRATARAKCRRASRPEASDKVWSSVVKPGVSTVTRYSPRGRLSKWNSPWASLVVVWKKSEVVERTKTWAPSTGRCCGSWMSPRMEPKTVAEARAVRIRTALASEVQSRGKFVSPSQQGGGWISIAELRDFLSLRDEV